MQAPDSVPATRMTAWQTVLLGGAAVAVLDGLDAVIFWGLRGVGPARVFQGVAAGLYGRSSFAGGATTALVGLAIHVFIACCVVGVYYLAATKLPCSDATLLSAVFSMASPSTASCTTS